jgi:hypothetical protein
MRKGDGGELLGIEMGEKRGTHGSRIVRRRYNRPPMKDASLEGKRKAEARSARVPVANGPIGEA